ncbi:MAG: DUF86 domain-containing protein [Mariprofundaceae bacterium]|nr:DUF86 domain-containing protein [Mariprofundaceae bacterium]
MDRVVIEEKLEFLRRCLSRVADKCPDDMVQLEQDIDLQDIITLNLTRAVQLSVDIAAHWVAGLEDIPAPGTMDAMFEALVQHGYLDPELAERMRRSVGFRNIAVHNYEIIEWQLVYAICKYHLDDFACFGKAVYSALPKNEV